MVMHRVAFAAAACVVTFCLFACILHLQGVELSQPAQRWNSQASLTSRKQDSNLCQHILALDVQREKMSFGKRWDSTWKGFYTINSRARVPSIFSEQRLSQTKRMIALLWQNINRGKISQWLRELYSCHHLEKITHSLRGRDDAKRVRFIYINHMAETT